MNAPIEPPVEVDFSSLLRNRINLDKIPFTERGSRLLVLKNDEGLIVNLAERWSKLDQSVSGYRERPPLMDQFLFVDSSGETLAFTLESYPHCLIFHTKAGDFRLVFLDAETLLLALPGAACGIRFRARVNSGKTDRRGGILRMTGQIKRNIAYTTNRSIASSELTELDADLWRVTFDVEAGEGGAILLNLTPRLGFNRYIPPTERVIEDAWQRWEDWFEKVPPVAEPYRSQYYYAWWIMRAGLLSSRYYLTREAMAPSKTHYVGIWQWDAYFHALAYSHVDPRIAKDQIRVMLDHQRDDGLIPDAVHDEGFIDHLDFPVSADVTKPPLLGWVVWRLFERDGDKEFLDEIYEPMVRWTRWWLERNDADGDGLCSYGHPYSSGLDDSPLWDEGMPVTSPDLNTYLVLQAESLGHIAEVLGLAEDAERWAKQADAITGRMLESLWDEDAGLFWARHDAKLHDGKVIKVTTPFSLFPLMTGRLPRGIVQRLVGHLINPEEFWTAFPVPTVARNDPKYDPRVMWRGPAWINVNYLLIQGLERCGYSAIAEDLRRRTLELELRNDDMYEYYDPENGAPDPTAASSFGWSAALFIEMALEETNRGQRQAQGEARY
jgi:glycogen debranching enzyme